MDIKIRSDVFGHSLVICIVCLGRVVDSGVSRRLHGGLATLQTKSQAASPTERQDKQKRQKQCQYFMS